MISYVRGILAEVMDDRIVVENNGIGIEIFIPKSLLYSLPNKREEVMIHTYFKVSEDAMSLYGFANRGDLEIFKLLISVNGVGPKGAMAILSVLGPSELKLAILSEDDKSISMAQGIGAKTAKRVILDLKDKIAGADVLEIGEYSGKEKLKSVDEAIEALVALGYAATEVAKVIKAIDIDESMSTESIIKSALKKF